MSEGVSGVTSGRAAPAASDPVDKLRPWGLLASLVWYVVIFEIASRAYDWIVTASGLWDLETNNYPLHVVDILLSWAKSLGILAFAVWLTGIPARRYFGWFRPRASDLTLGVLVVLIVSVTANLVSGGIAADVADYRDSLSQGISPWWFALQPWPAIVFAPLLEENFFRGLLWRGVQTRLGNWGALLISSGMFILAHDFYDDSGIHWDTVAVLYTFGLAVGWLRWRSGGTVAPMIAHALSNALEAPLVIALSTFGAM